MSDRQKNTRAFKPSVSSHLVVMVAGLFLILSLTVPSYINGKHALLLLNPRQAMAQTATLPTSSTSVVAPTTFSTYKNSTYGIEILYPSSWAKLDNGTLSHSSVMQVINLYDPVGTGNLFVFVDNASGIANESLATYTADIIQGIKTSRDFQNFTLMSSNLNSRFLGLPAFEFLYVYHRGVDPPNTMTLADNIGTIINNKVYMVEFGAVTPEISTYLPIFQKMIGSVQIDIPNATKALQQQPINSNVPEI